MPVVTHELEVSTAGYCDVKDITEAVAGLLQQSGLREGTATVFAPGATAGITTLEYEPGAVADLRRAIERAAPEDLAYEHDRRWGDGNGFSHVRAALIGPSLSVPFTRGKLLLGTWQQIVVLDFDNRRRTRRIVVQLYGD